MQNIVILKPAVLLENHKTMITTFIENFNKLTEKDNFKIIEKESMDAPVVYCVWAVLENGKYIDEREVLTPHLAEMPLELIKKIDKSKNAEKKILSILEQEEDIFGNITENFR